MKRIILAILLSLCISGCGFKLTEIQHGINGGVRYAESGGETYSYPYPSGHYEKRGDWYIGGDLRFIYTK